MGLHKSGVLEKFGVEVIGAKPEAIHKAEDRGAFKAAMQKIGIGLPNSAVAHNWLECQASLENVGLPAVIRPGFTMGGTGGGIAFNKEEYEEICRKGLAASPTSEVLIEEYLAGWKEFELEVMRDKKDNFVVICSIENLDPMGVHTGDSITVAPALTLTDKEYQLMRDDAKAIMREIGVETGGSNVQFAVDPRTGRRIVIEMNPRVSRSSALHRALHGTAAAGRPLSARRFSPAPRQPFRAAPCRRCATRTPHPHPRGIRPHRGERDGSCVLRLVPPRAPVARRSRAERTARSRVASRPARW
jgi:carbamoyl-phosphate synthase large subunit